MTTTNRIIAISAFNRIDAKQNKTTFGILKNDNLYLDKKQRNILSAAYNILSGTKEYPNSDLIIKVATDIVNRTYTA